MYYLKQNLCSRFGKSTRRLRTRLLLLVILEICALYLLILTSSWFIFGIWFKKNSFLENDAF
jgi:hypothetical protein